MAKLNCSYKTPLTDTIFKLPKQLNFERETFQPFWSAFVLAQHKEQDRLSDSSKLSRNWFQRMCLCWWMWLATIISKKNNLLNGAQLLVKIFYCSQIWSEVFILASLPSIMMMISQDSELDCVYFSTAGRPKIFWYIKIVWDHQYLFPTT